MPFYDVFEKRDFFFPKGRPALWVGVSATALVATKFVTRDV